MKTILVVEDDEIARTVLNQIISESGEFHIINAQNGQDAIEQLSVTPHVDAILLDRNMPKMDGLETIKIIKSNPALARIPVIFQTAADSDAEVIEGTLAGAFYYLKKPYEAELVLSILRSAVVSKNM